MGAQVKESTIPKVIVKKIVHAKREVVFDAWTKPELMQKWFFPGNGSATSKNDLRVGGTYHHDMVTKGKDSTCSTGAQSEPEEANHYPHSGEYLEISPPARVVFTWNSPNVKDTRVSVDLRDLGDSTEVTITHELLDTEEQRAAHTGGWDACLANLEAFFA